MSTPEVPPTGERATAVAPLPPTVDAHVPENPVDPASAASASLDRSLVRGVAWTAAAKWGGQIVAWGSTFLVMRLLTPEDYGIVGLAATYLGLLAVISEFGIGTALIAQRDLNDEQIAQVHGLSVLLGVVGLLLSCTVAVPLGWFFRSPELPWVVVALSTTFVVRSLGSVPFTLLRRDLRFKRLAAYDAAQTVFLAVVGVTLAWLGFRYWSLVLVNVAAAILSTGIALVFHPQRLAWPRLRTIRSTVNYGGTVLVERFAWFAFSNSDFLVAGRMLGQAAVGVYQQAWSLAFTPLEKTAQLLMSVTPPIFSAVQHDTVALRRYFFRITEGVSLVAFPLAVGLALVADDFVRAVLAERWYGMVLPLQILSVYGVARSIFPLLSQVVLMTGQPEVSAKNMVLAAIVMPITFVVASRWGVVGIALSWVIVHPLVTLPLWIQVMRRVGTTTWEYLSEAIWPALCGTLVMSAAVLAVASLLGDASPALRLVVKVLVGAVAYGLTILVAFRGRMGRYQNILATMRR